MSPLPVNVADAIGGDGVTHSNGVDGNVDVHMAHANILMGSQPPPPREGAAKLDFELGSNYSSEKQVDKDMEGKSDDQHGERDSDGHGEEECKMADPIIYLGWHPIIYSGWQPPPGEGEAKQDGGVTHSNGVDGNVDVHTADANICSQPPPVEGEAKLDVMVLSDSESDSEFPSKQEVDEDVEGISDDEHREKDSDIWTGPPLETDEEIQEEIDALVALESEAAELQEDMEEEALDRARCEVRLELSEKFADPDKLAAAVVEEMSTYQSMVEERLVEIEDEITYKQERLDAAGASLPAIYKEIEKETPNHCKTDAWKKRAHWAGLQETSEVRSIVKDAESELEKSRPVPRLRGRTFEAGASGMLAKKFDLAISADAPVDQGWRAFDARTEADADAKIYVASTPQEAALVLGPEVPAANEVEEILALEDAGVPFSEARKDEGENGLTNTQRENLKKIDEQNVLVSKYTTVKPRKRKGANR